MIVVQREPVDVGAVLDAVGEAGDGAVVLFVGQVRERSRGSTVTRLDYQAYGSMAVSEMRALAQVAMEEHGAAGVAMAHREGELGVGDVAVAIAVSAPHRPAAFEACRWLIDTLKERVPIWKKEWTDDGGEWVSEHP